MKPSATGYDQPPHEMDRAQLRRRVLARVVSQMYGAVEGTLLLMWAERKLKDNGGGS